MKTKNGSCCVFPFNFYGKKLESCTTLGRPVNSPLLWCATTSDYNADALWGECKVDAEGKRNVHCATVFYCRLLLFEKVITQEPHHEVGTKSGLKSLGKTVYRLFKALFLFSSNSLDTNRSKCIIGLVPILSARS